MFERLMAIVSVTFALGGAFAQHTLGAEIAYSVVPISIEANGISNSGTVIINYGAMWTSSGGEQLVGLSPMGVSASGILAGSKSLPNSVPTRIGAVIWENGQMVSLQALRTGPEVEEAAMRVNDAGVAVGYSYAGVGNLRAVRWTNATAEDLGPVLGAAASGSVARAINNSGQIVLTSSSGGHPNGGADDQSFLLSGNTLTPITSNSPEVIGVHAQAINDGGQIAGSLVFADGATNAFVWSEGQMLVGAATFAGKPGSTYGAAINDLGVVVGAFSPSDHGPSIAFMWDEVNAPVNLNSLIDPQSGWYLYAALGVNDDGEIVGNGLLNGVPTGFLLTPSGSAPTPEPATAGILVVGGMLLLRRERRRH